MSAGDYDMVRAIKLGDDAMRLVLFQRYQPLINKRSMLTQEHEDFKQNAYEVMLDEVDKVDLLKIKDPNTWGFYFSFSMALIKLALSMNRATRDYVDLSAECYLGDDAMPEDDLSPTSTSLMSHVVNDVFTRYAPQQELNREHASDAYESFMQTCTGRERDVLYLKGLGLSVGDMVKYLPISRTRISKMIIDMRDRAYHIAARAMQ
jgi:hypothetical protein